MLVFELKEDEQWGTFCGNLKSHYFIIGYGSFGQKLFRCISHLRILSCIINVWVRTRWNFADFHCWKAILICAGNKGSWVCSNYMDTICACSSISRNKLHWGPKRKKLCWYIYVLLWFFLCSIAVGEEKKRKGPFFWLPKIMLEFYFKVYGKKEEKHQM